VQHSILVTVGGGLLDTAYSASACSALVAAAGASLLTWQCFCWWLEFLACQPLRVVFCSGVWDSCWRLECLCTWSNARQALVVHLGQSAPLSFLACFKRWLSVPSQV
jgi:hypothetical protein